jgi:hypothetical protein
MLFGGGIVFFTEFVRFLLAYLGSLTIYLNYFIYFGASLTTYFGGSLG